MDWKTPFDRRKFIKVVGAIAGGVVASWVQDRLDISLSSAEANVPDPETCLCSNQVSAQAIGGPRVVHVHAPSATSWNGIDTQYWDFVNQSVVDEMVDRGVLTLTGAASVADAWSALLPNYQQGQGIAIKVSFNNCFTCGNAGTAIDGLIEPVNAVIRGLLQIGVLESDIWIYDAIRALPDRFVDQCAYSNVQFFDNGCHNASGWSSSDPDAFITFNTPSGVPSPPPIKITDVLINATYLINMPIMKRHATEIGASLAFKNHFGTINNPGGLHQYIRTDDASYRADYSPLVDLHSNPHIGNKTVLTIGDGLFASKIYNQSPSTWSTFGGEAPSSLFFATDPVALDCVMLNLLEDEVSLSPSADDYLLAAANAGLGVFERGDPWQQPFGSGYSSIEYIRLTHPFTTFVDVPSTHWAYDYIEAIYQAGIVVGCSIDPPLYCPERILDRAESSVFILRGNYGAIPDPPYTPPVFPTFGDVDPSFWGYGWIESLWRDGFTAGCSTDPLLYCPSREHTRAEASVFFLRIKNGVAYQPPTPVGLFADVDIGAWYAGWVEAAYNEGLLPECGTNPLAFCPEAPLDRSWAAYMMCQAKNLPVP